MVIGKTVNGHDITALRAATRIHEKICDYEDILNNIGFVTNINTWRGRRGLLKKLGCKQRITALRESLNSIIAVECALLNGEVVRASDVCRVNRSLSHLFGKLQRDWLKKECRYYDKRE